MFASDSFESGNVLGGLLSDGLRYCLEMLSKCSLALDPGCVSRELQINDRSSDHVQNLSPNVDDAHQRPTQARWESGA